MMKAKILPFKDSIISYTPNMDHFLSVLENQSDYAIPWIFENYIDLIIRKDNINPPVFEFLDYNKIWWTCPFVHVSRIAREAFNIYGEFSETIRRLIDKNFYLFFLVDTYYVDGYVTYMKEHMMHDIFIYGYEDDYVYACDYFDFQKKGKVKIKMSEIEIGYNNVHNKDDYGRGIVLFHSEEITDNIVLYQYKESLNGIYDVECKGYTMDRNLVKTKLGRFLESSPYINSVTPTWFDYRLGYTTGFNVFYVLRNAIKKNIPVTPKDLHLVCCHIQLMIKRLDYLAEKESVEECFIIRKHIEKSLEKAVFMKNLLLKKSIKKESLDQFKFADYMTDFIDGYKENLTQLYLVL